MFLIDTHTHLFDEAFNADRSEVVNNALASGVEKMILPCVNPQSLEPINAMLKNWYDIFYPAVGLHPEDITENFENQMDTIFNFKFLKPPIAVGEIGIDLYWRQDNLDLQTKVFEYQLNKAVELNLPVIIHCRNAYKQIFDVLEKFDLTKLSGVFHCFCGGKEEALQILDYKTFMFGIGGVITFKKSGAETASTVADYIPIDKILLETDSPYLAPTPKRGKRNESAFITFTAKKLAEIKNISEQEIISATTCNAKKLFKID